MQKSFTDVKQTLIYLIINIFVHQNGTFTVVLTETSKYSNIKEISQQ